MFILAKVDVANKNREGALENSEKAIQETKDQKVVAWSHVYLGRILDMKEDREGALERVQRGVNFCIEPERNCRK